MFPAATVSAQTLVDAVEARDYALMEKMLVNGADPNGYDSKGQFPLWNAVWNDDAKSVNLLIRKGASVKRPFLADKGKIYLVEIATQEGHADIVRMLVDNGADIKQQYLQGYTVLHIAARRGHLDLVQYYLAQGAGVNVAADDGTTPLELAAGKGFIEIVKVLADGGADVNVQDRKGNFALGEAARYGHLDVVKFLVSNGARKDLKNEDGHTATDLAFGNRQVKVAAFLKEKTR
ncbi:hypothetical protein FPE01S_01_10370 [Flavihumibacter petaseus NBRC 106054]|uniref:Uncharacterized protein n=2 Tax=Flavihumibacter TaxID=1004301 RepID=A0A0E9MWR3_9BACT|nr:hypothetical protein FPE01S_01_10370 [Flavihumibacter petaseus NBRC 106054]